MALVSLWHIFSRISVRGLRWHTPAQYLITHHDLASTYNEQELQKMTGANHDQYEEVLLSDASQDILEKVAHELWQFNIFPSSVMRIHSTFHHENRKMKEGDLIYENVQIIPHLLDTIAVNKIEKIIDEEKKKGFHCHGTKIHDEKGCLICFVELRPAGELVLTMNALSCFSPFFLIPPFKWVSRYLQKRAHRKGIEHIRATIRQWEIKKK